MIKLLNHLNFNFRVFGSAESCTGDPARRMGEEGLFQQLANRNLKLFARHRVLRVLTHCPHCFNTFKNEYPRQGKVPPVEHHTQFLARMAAEGLLTPKRRDARSITFHDPCYLGRGNGETAAPRSAIVAATGKAPIEMPRHGRNSFCCGAGGGSMWTDVPGERRVENLRAAEALSTGAMVVATGCPFCKTMLEASFQSSFEGRAQLPVKDIAEIWVEAVGL
jgi:Fe-S oxidoreductase